MKTKVEKTVRRSARSRRKITQTVQPARSRRRTIAQIVQRRGSIAQFARDLSHISGQEVTWARVNNWILRDSVSKSMAFYVHKLTRAPLADLLD